MRTSSRSVARSRAAERSDPSGLTRARLGSNREELRALYRPASLCVVPSRFEAFPYTALEAMACGRPGGGQLLLDTGARLRLARAARVRVLSSFSAHAVAARMAELYVWVARR